MLEEQFHSAVGNRFQCIQYRLGAGKGGIITDPGFEDITEQIKLVGTAGIRGQKMQKRPDQVRALVEAIRAATAPRTRCSA